MSAKPQASNTPDLDQLLERLTTYYPRAIDPNLDRTFRLLNNLGNPQDHLPPVIHIAGTNGKGSTLATMRAIAEAAGMSCHVMTSPHLVSFHERLVIAGKEIETGPLIDILLETEKLNAGQETTSFELTTAAGLLAFARAPADLCLLETGMGGRLDATNVVRKPIATVITVISLDHTQFLGTTLDAIAGEKAAIMKTGTPCIIGPQTGDGLRAGVMRVFEDVAEKTGAPLYRHSHEWSYEPTRDGFILHTGTDSYNFPRPNLLGAHQIGNAATAAMTLLTIQAALPRTPSATAFDMGLTHVKWRARLQKLERGPLIDLLPADWELWLDGGHNDTGGQVLAEQATAWAGQDDKKLHLVMGMLNTKDPRVFLKYLGPHATSMHTIEIPAQPLSLSAHELAEAARDVVTGHVIPLASARDAIAAILKDAPAPGRILITGSLYLAGEILKENG